MTGLRKLVAEYADDLRDGIQWVVFWKEKGKWKAERYFFETGSDGEEYLIDSDKKELEEIYQKDPKAIPLNGYIHGMFYEDASISHMVTAVRYYYSDTGGYRMENFLEEFSLKRQEKKTFSKEEFLKSDCGEYLKTVVKSWNATTEHQDMVSAAFFMGYCNAASDLLKYFLGCDFKPKRSKYFYGMFSYNTEEWLFKIERPQNHKESEQTDNITKKEKFDKLKFLHTRKGIDFYYNVQRFFLELQYPTNGFFPYFEAVSKTLQEIKENYGIDYHFIDEGDKCGIVSEDGKDWLFIYEQEERG